MEKDAPATAAAVAAGKEEAPLPQALLDRAVKNLHHMLRAQGSVEIPLATDNRLE